MASDERHARRPAHASGARAVGRRPALAPVRDDARAAISFLPPRYARLALELKLEDLDLRRILDPSPAIAFERALTLTALRRNDEAKRAYREILAVEPNHLGALNNLATILYQEGSRRAARRAYETLVANHPQSAIAHTHLAKVLHQEGMLDEAVRHYQRAVELDPTAAVAHHGLAAVLTERGEESAAAIHRRLGFQHRPVALSRYTGDGPPVRVLLVGVEEQGNIPTGGWFDEATFLVATLIVEYFDAELPLPEHDVVFNVIGDADRCALALAGAKTLLEHTTAPVLNRPESVLRTGRFENAERLGQLEDVITPRFAVFPRWLLDRTDAQAALAASGFGWPLLLRVPGFHTGEYFVKVDSPETLPAALVSLPGNAVMAIEFLDARSDDGYLRKYRVIAVDRKLYPLHVAISTYWKVHYFSADMSENAANRAEDAAFLESMQVLQPRTLAALERIAAALDLDYAGLDFACDRDGRVLLFEANATMIVPQPPDDERWAYRRKPVRAILDAVRRMVRERAALAC